jgi:hypothetical protein
MCAMKSRGARFASVLLACSLALSACGGGDDGKDKDKDSGPTDTPSTGVELTEPGSELELGEAATATWSPNQKTSGAIGLTVTRIDKGPARDLRAIKVNPPLKDPRLYYVHFTLENKGDADFGGLSPLALELYLDDGSDVLQPAADIRVRFDSCPLAKLPARFAKGKSAKLCLVYAVEADLVNMSLRPDATSPLITWTGKVTSPVKKPAPKKKKQG